jgi:hypothetical protein
MSRAAVVSLAALVAFGTSSNPVLAPPPIVAVEEESLVLEIRALTVAPERSATLTVEPGQRATGALLLPWPASDRELRIGLEARAAGRRAEGGAIELELVALVPRSGGPPSRAVRRLAVGERATTLFEIARDETAGPLTLVVSSERVTETVLRTGPILDRPVRLRLELQEVAAGHARSLETNSLDTIVGETVGYGFRFDEAGQPVSLEVSLRPLEIRGESIELRLAIAGSIPGADAPQIVARTEEWVSARGAASSFDVTTGEPPSGYRVVVTPVF